MIRSSAATVSLHRTADLLVVAAALLFLAPLLVVTFALLLVVRDGAGRTRGAWAAAIDHFLYRSGLGELPFLFDLLAGRASLFNGRQIPEREAGEIKAINLLRRDATLKFDPAPRPWIGSDVEMLGQHLRASFAAECSVDFDELLSAIDRA